MILAASENNDPLTVNRPRFLCKDMSGDEPATDDCFLAVSRLENTFPYKYKWKLLSGPALHLHHWQCRSGTAAQRFSWNT
jgi:hypothetical protein